MRLNKKLGIIMLNQDWKIGLSLIISVKKLLKNLRKELSISRKLKSMHKGLIGYCLAMTVKTLFTKDFRRTWLKMAANDSINEVFKPIRKYLKDELKESGLKTKDCRRIMNL